MENSFHQADLPFTVSIQPESELLLCLWLLTYDGTIPSLMARVPVNVHNEDSLSPHCGTVVILIVMLHFSNLTFFFAFNKD